MLLRKTLLVLCLTIPVVGHLDGQVFAPAAHDSFTASYDPESKVFVFNRSAYKAPLAAEITAVSHDNLSGWTFNWAVYNQQTSVYTGLTPSGSGKSSSIDTITVSSGYQVVMTKGGETYTYRVWVLLNDLDVVITNKDADDTLKFGYYSCGSVDFRADTVRSPLFYHNPSTGAKVFAPNSYIIRWSTNNTEASVPPSRLITRVTKLPWQDTWYKITIVDDYGLSRSDSVVYNSIQSKAVLTKQYIPLSDEEEYPNRNYEDFYDDDIFSAPGKFRFDLSGSRNMAGYQLVFGDGDTIVYSKDSLTIVHEYKKPGVYKAVLTTKSDPPDECLDSVSIEVELDYASADNFNIPNVFTPNHGSNVFKSGDIFRTSDVSVVFVEITIFTRTGLKVHHYSGNIRDWQGWDGRIMDSGREAPTGVYFYVISRFGAYSDKTNPINHNLMKGFIHLYR
jgi:hypothetical protein